LLTPAEEKKVLVLDIGEAEGKLYLQEQVEACNQRHMSFKIGTTPLETKAELSSGITSHQFRTFSSVSIEVEHEPLHSLQYSLTLFMI
jgi:hypothetical protein